jgi:perosamine synthetase
VTSGPPGSTIPLARPNLSRHEQQLVAEVLASGILAMGPFTQRFEELLAHMVGRRHGIAVSSGTAGLHLAVRALGLGTGDRVITTPFSFVASSNCLLFEGVEPVFVDIEEASLGLDPDAVAHALDDEARGVLAVDVFGAPCRIEEIADLCRQRDVLLIEDSCEALGTSLNGRPLGSFGEASVFAFYPNKQITTGEGGMVVTDDDSLADKMRSMRNQGRDADGTWLRHVQLGYNYRIDEMSAAVGVAQLERYAELRGGRERVFKLYCEALDPLPWLSIPLAPKGSDVDWFVFVVRVRPELDRDRLLRDLSQTGVPARPYFSPIHLQPYYRERYDYRPGMFPVTERIAQTTVALPFSSLHTESEVARVVEALVAAAGKQGIQ